MRACVDACRQGNGSGVTAQRTQPSAANVNLPPPLAVSILVSLPSVLSTVLTTFLFLGFSFSRPFSRGLARLAHAPGATDSSGLGGHRAHAPVPTRVSRSLSHIISISVSRAGRSLFPHRRSVFLSSLSLSPSHPLILLLSIYIHTLSPSCKCPPPTRSPSRSPPSRSSTRPANYPILFPSHKYTRQRRRPRLESAIIDVSYRGDSPTSSDFGTLLSAVFLALLPALALSRTGSRCLASSLLSSSIARTILPLMRNHPSRVPLKTAAITLL